MKITGQEWWGVAREDKCHECRDLKWPCWTHREWQRGYEAGVLAARAEAAMADET